MFDFQLAAAQNPGTGELLMSFLPLVLIIAIMYFIMIRPQKKRQKEEQKMRESLQVGDELLTIGGIYGRVVSIKDDSIVIESSADHSKIKLAKWAISQNLTVHEAEAVVKAKKKEKSKDEDEKIKIKED